MCQKCYQFCRSPCSMAEGQFLGNIHFGKGLISTFGNKNRVVPKALITSSFGNDLSIANAFKQGFLPIHDHRNDGPETGLPVRLVFQFYEEFIYVPVE